MRLSAAAASVAVLVSVLVLSYISGRFARRLLRLQVVARRIGEGEPGVRAPEDPGDDLGQLGRALNDMRDRARHSARGASRASATTASASSPT